MIRDFLLTLIVIIIAPGCGSSIMSLGGISAGGNKEKGEKVANGHTQNEDDAHTTPQMPVPGLIACDDDLLGLTNFRYLSRHTVPEMACPRVTDLSRPDCIAELHFLSDEDVRIGSFTDESEYLISSTLKYKTCGDIVVVHNKEASLALTVAADGRSLTTLTELFAFNIAE